MANVSASSLLEKFSPYTCHKSHRSIVIPPPVQQPNTTTHHFLTTDLLVVPPLVKGRGGLVVFETFQDCTVDDDLVVLQLPPHHPECVVDKVMVDVNLGEAMAGSGWHPLLVEVIVDHDAGPGGRDALLGPLVAATHRTSV